MAAVFSRADDQARTECAPCNYQFIAHLLLLNIPQHIVTRRAMGAQGSGRNARTQPFVIPSKARNLSFILCT
jgi:hypothetical protein